MPEQLDPVKVIQEEISAFGAMLRSKQINEELYHKLLVAAAYQFANVGEFLRAAAVVQSIPVEYFQNVQPRHMTEDKDYCEASYALAKMLVEQNLIDLAPAVAYNHPPAQA
jgi:uncharacterized protein with von Willebrand factor type A (vWA) domain